MTLAVRPSTLEVYMRREFAAPREVVFAAWTNERLIGGWWASRDYTTLACTMDVRPGGAWSRRLMAPDGGLINERGVYREVVALERRRPHRRSRDAGDGDVRRPRRPHAADAAS